MKPTPTRWHQQQEKESLLTVYVFVPLFLVYVRYEIAKKIELSSFLTHIYFLGILFLKDYENKTQKINYIMYK